MQKLVSDVPLVAATRARSSGETWEQKEKERPDTSDEDFLKDMSFLNLMNKKNRWLPYAGW